MIRINLLAEKKAAKAKAKRKGVSLNLEGMAGGQNVILVGILALGVLVAGGWWWARNGELKELQSRKAAAEVEAQRLKEIRARYDQYKVQKELLERKIALITNLKKKQTVPVHIMDQVSRNVPDFLWLDSMSALSNQINVSGKATTYTAVSNFYDNLTSSGYFDGVVLGKTAEVPEGVSFSLLCRFSAPQPRGPETDQG